MTIAACSNRLPILAIAAAPAPATTSASALKTQQFSGPLIKATKTKVELDQQIFKATNHAPSQPVSIRQPKTGATSCYGLIRRDYLVAMLAKFCNISHERNPKVGAFFSFCSRIIDIKRRSRVFNAVMRFTGVQMEIHVVYVDGDWVRFNPPKRHCHA